MKKKKIKILFVIPTLAFGGAERILIFLSQNISNKEFDSELIIIGKRMDNGYDTSNINVTYLESSRVLKSIPKLISKIKNRKPDIVVGTLSHVNVVLGSISFLFPGVFFVGRQTSITKVYKEISKTNKIDWSSIYLKYALKRLDYIICQSRDMASDCISMFGVKEHKIKIFNNPITDNFPLDKNRLPKKTNNYRFITVGRLYPVKGHKRVLDILAKFKKPFTYMLIGDGPLKDEIFQYAEDLGILDTLKHIPYTNEVAKYLNESDFFLQGSLSEGFPNALLESCAVGTPVLAFNAPGGTKEIVENGVNGFLLDNKDLFLNRLENLPVFDPKQVSESVYQKFDKAIVLKHYEDFFKSII